MKLTKREIKQIIKEELQKILKEGKNYTIHFNPDSAAIYFIDEETDGDQDAEKDYNIGKAAVERIPKQSVRFGHPNYQPMKNYYISRGYEFDNKGLVEKVKPPNRDKFVEFIFRYVKAKGE
jgi:hypothetical protein